MLNLELNSTFTEDHTKVIKNPNLEINLSWDFDGCYVTSSIGLIIISII